jgi:rhodanese-related sulfurtransferase
MRSILKHLPGISFIVLIAAILGLTTNALRSDGLPFIRKPLKETRKFVTKTQLTSGSVITTRPHQAKPELKPTVDEGSPKPVEKKPAAPIAAASGAKKPLIEPQIQAVKTAPAKNAAKPSPKPKAEALFTTLTDAKACYDAGSAIFIDGRHPDDYAAEHIPGAISLYSEELDKLYDQVLGSVPKDRLIITYCSDPECTEAMKLGDALVARGHTRVVILQEGLPGWKDAGYPTITGKGTK